MSSSMSTFSMKMDMEYNLEDVTLPSGVIVFFLCYRAFRTIPLL